MKFHKLVAVALAALLVSAGAAAAVPGNAPDGAQDDEHANADDYEQANDHREDDDANVSDDREAGPSADPPEQAPDFVSKLHKRIMMHVNGDLSGADLGTALSDLTPGQGDAENGRSGEDHGQTTETAA